MNEAVLKPDNEIILDEAPLPEAAVGTNRVPGNKAIWVGIFSEMSEFAMMFLIIFLAKVHNPEVFEVGPTQLNTLAGTINTLILLSSSFFVARAMIAIRQNRRQDCATWLWLAILAGCSYLLTKYWEFEWLAERGFEIETNVFFGAFYYTTFNHFLHVGWGSFAILWVLLRLKSGAYTPEEHDGLEAVATYWHMIDLAWIVIFPLLYVWR